MKYIYRSIIAVMCLGAPLVAFQVFHNRMPLWFGPDQYAIRGQFGDQFGALNAIFSGVAAGGLLLTLYFTLAQLHLMEKDHKDAKKDRLRDERIDALTLLLRSVTTQIEITGAAIRIDTVLFHEAEGRALAEPRDTLARTTRERIRGDLEKHQSTLKDLMAQATSIRDEVTRLR